MNYPFKAVHISTMLTQTKWSRALWLTNDKASYVDKEDSICWLSIAKEATLNEQWIKPGVPLDKVVELVHGGTAINGAYPA